MNKLEEKKYDISIIVPSKNRLWSLPKAIDTCRSSSLNIQIIVVNDCSTDGTTEWLIQQPDITVLEGYGWGKPWAVNKAMALAGGKYIRFLDSDDWLNQSANETQFKIAEETNADVVLANYHLYIEDSLTSSGMWEISDDFIAQQLGESDGSHYSAFLFKYDFIKDIPHRTHFPSSDFASRDDRCFILEVALKNPRISSCNTPTLCHRHHTKERLQFQNSLKGVGTHIQHLYIYKQILSMLESRGDLTLRRRKAAANVLWPLAHRIAYTHLNEGADLVKYMCDVLPEFRVPESGLLGFIYRRLGFRSTEKLLLLRRTIIRIFSRFRKFRTNAKP